MRLACNPYQRQLTFLALTALDSGFIPPAGVAEGMVAARAGELHETFQEVKNLAQPEHASHNGLSFLLAHVFPFFDRATRAAGYSRFSALHEVDVRFIAMAPVAIASAWAFAWD